VDVDEHGHILTRWSLSATRIAHSTPHRRPRRRRAARAKRRVLAREAPAPRRGLRVVRRNYAKDCSQTKRSIMSDAE